MLKKHIQNILLVLSVLVTFVLVYQIWFSSSFLPGGRESLLSGFSRSILNPIISLFDGNNEANFSENLQSLLKPEKIVLNSSGKRLVYSDGSETFRKVRELSTEFVKGGFLKNYAIKSRETVSEETYQSVLKSKSIYVDYGKDCDFRLLSYSICGEEKNSFTDDLRVVHGYVIGLQDGILNDLSLYFKDQESGTVYRYIIEADKAELTEEIEQLMDEEVGGTNSYSFELNFHKQQESAVSKVLFEPMLLMDLAPIQLPDVRNLSEDEGERLLDAGMEETILDAFSINNRTMRKYTDLNDARVFVENNATLTLYPQGLLVYQTVPGDKGLDLTDGAGTSNYDVYAATADGVNFVAELCQQISPGLFDKLKISSDLVENAENQGVYRICFDYAIGGVPVRVQVGEEYDHTIEIEIDNGYLKSYRQYIKVYDATEGQQQLIPMIQAADTLVDEMYAEGSPLYIKTMTPCYVENEEGKLELAWRAFVNNTERIVK